eukprot:8135241-Ditylum_brightwellii.AAC.2
MWKQVADNLQYPSCQVKNPDKIADKDLTVPQTPFVFGAKTQKRLFDALELMSYYKTVGWDLTVSSIKYDPVIKFFTYQWKRLTDWEKNTQSAIPMITIE